MPALPAGMAAWLSLGLQESLLEHLEGGCAPELIPLSSSSVRQALGQSLLSHVLLSVWALQSLGTIPTELEKLDMQPFKCLDFFLC